MAVRVPLTREERAARDAFVESAEAGSADVSDVLGQGFPSAELAGAAVGLLPVTACESPESWVSLGRGHGYSSWDERLSLRLDVGPGVVAVRVRSEAREERAVLREQDRRACVSDGTPVPGRRGRIACWSAKSRAGMVRAMAGGDWRPMVASGIPAMVTLTYPQAWTLFAPSREVVNRHVEAWRERWRRKWGQAPAGAWKIEYQRRGAPHLHILCGVPHVPLGEFRAWVAQSWASVVWRSRVDAVRDHLRKLGYDSFAVGLYVADHRARHEKAGTAVDLSEGLKCRDPRRIAVYFLRHSAPGRVSSAGPAVRWWRSEGQADRASARHGKHYQHTAPLSWGGRAGRFWGLWRIPQLVESVYLTPRAFVLVRRTLRRWAHANRRVSCVRSGYALSGGWVAVNSGPVLMAGLARALALEWEAERADPL